MKKLLLTLALSCCCILNAATNAVAIETQPTPAKSLKVPESLTGLGYGVVEPTWWATWTPLGVEMCSNCSYDYSGVGQSYPLRIYLGNVVENLAAMRIYVTEIGNPTGNYSLSVEQMINGAYNQYVVAQRRVTTSPTNYYIDVLLQGGIKSGLALNLVINAQYGSIPTHLKISAVR